MAEYKTIPLDKILVPTDRLREVEEDHALAIQATIVEHGLLQPITVRATPRASRPYTLVIGAHRLRAVELNDEHEIDAFVVKADAEEAQLIEITENLARNELSVLDRAMSVITYRDLWEQKYGKIEAGSGGDRKSEAYRINRANFAQLIQDEAERGFSIHVADRLGLSRRAVYYLHDIAQKILPDLRRALRGTPAADNQSLLLRLTRLDPERQRQIVQAMGLGKNPAEAIDLTEPNPKAQAAPANKRYSAVVSNFKAMGRPERTDAFRELFRSYPVEVREALAELENEDDGLPSVSEVLDATKPEGLLQ